MKIILALFGFAAVASAADLTVGNEGGSLIFEQNVTASPTIWKQTRNLTVNATDDAVISRVVVIDNRPEKDGEAKVVEGGEGEKNVTIELKGPAVFRGFDFTIQVFAAPENENTQHPKATGHDTQQTQLPQVPEVQITKDLNVNDHSNQHPKNTDDIILGAPVPTASSTTEENKTNKDGQVKTNVPALVGDDKTRKYRETEPQKNTEQAPIAVPKDAASGVNATKTEAKENDKDLKVLLDSIFVNYSAPKSEEGQEQVHPVMPENDQVQTDLIQSDEDRKVRQASMEPIAPAVLPKELKGNDVQTTKKVEVSSTTPKGIQEKVIPSVVPVTSESSSTSAEDLNTELPEDLQATKDSKGGFKGPRFEHRPAVPLPYIN
ncbi:uncharacterized protein LOC110378043 [Helicoverpa armigera]|uniref:uncharacterized protein LOC110378043 n=1 Tax=Helicoverpa armigera TaxID=29058 RepID=UPI0030839A7C